MRCRTASDGERTIVNIVVRHAKSVAAAIVLLAAALVPQHAPASPVMALPEAVGAEVEKNARALEE